MTIESDAELKEIFKTCRTIAVVGCSPKPERAGHYIARFLQQQGYRVIPVNPGHAELVGERCYASLRDIPEPVDMVDCFRRPEEMLSVVTTFAIMPLPAYIEITGWNSFLKITGEMIR